MIDDHRPRPETETPPALGRGSRSAAAVTGVAALLAILVGFIPALAAPQGADRFRDALWAFDTAG